MTRHCDNPLCDSPPFRVDYGSDPRRYCSTSCRVSTHRTHRRRIELIEGTLAAYGTAPADRDLRRIAVNVYRISRGLPRRELL